MVSRLVLGCGSLAGALVHALADRPGTVEVLADDEAAVQRLREEGVAAEAGDPTDVAALAQRDPPDTVAVATDGPERTLAAARAAREAFPEAFVLAYGDADADRGSDATAALEAAVDRVVDPAAATTSYLLERVGDAGVRTRKLAGTLRDIDGRLAVVTHDNPDPDAIGSAVALRRIAAGVGVPADVCYFGDISHQENRAFVNLLEFDLRNLDPGTDLAEYAGVALVDHSRPGVNDGLPEDTPVDVVIDHHPPRFPVEARFVDLRSDVGATSTLLVEYLRKFGITPSRDVATGLVFGIRVDTDEFTREVSAADFEAAAFLQPYADLGTLERIESPSVSPETLETIARAIRNRETEGTVLVSGVGKLANRDALAQAADRLLDLEGVTVTFVYGVADGTVYVSARGRGSDLDLGEALRDAFGQIGSAGGHADMAGAQISLGLLDDVDGDDEDLLRVVDSVVADRFRESIDSHTHRVIGDVYPADFHGVEEFDETTLGTDEFADERPAGAPDPDHDAPGGDDETSGVDDGALEGDDEASETDDEASETDDEASETDDESSETDDERSGRDDEASGTGA